jgi:DNA-binding Lrp family transcriptional regulator
MTAPAKLDRIDLKILAELQKNGRITNVDLAEAVGLSPSPCLTRVKRLEQAGYITGYGAQLQLRKLATMISRGSRPRSATCRRSSNATSSAAATTTC